MRNDEVLINAIYDQAWNIVKVMQSELREETYYSARAEELRKFIELLKQIPDKIENISIHDIDELFNPIDILFSLGKRSIHEIEKGNIKARLQTLLGPPISYEFCFRLGPAGVKTEGFQIGSGKLFSFGGLPKKFREGISEQWKYDYKDDREYTQTFREYCKMRRETDWFMLLEVTANGHFKATEKAIQALRRNLSAAKVIYFTETYFQEIAASSSPFKYFASTRASDYVQAWGEPQKAFHRIIVFRYASYDEEISKINAVINSENRNELQERILNAIDVFGMIESSTPLHIRFMLCIIALEGMLLSKDDRDYLGWKLAEKISFLLGDSWAWMATTYNIGHEQSETITPEFIAKNTPEARIMLSDKVKELYNKRSSFAHHGIGGKKKKGDGLNGEDYDMASLLVRWTITKLLEMLDNGITHLAKQKKMDGQSLDYELEKLKYN